MRFLLCLLAALLLASGPLTAQTPSPAPLGTVAADSGAVLVFNDWYLPAYRPGTGADTTGALLSLFRKRRYAGFLFMAPAIVGLSLTFRLSSTDQYGQQHVADKAISPPLGIAILAGTLGGFIYHAHRFNKTHLIALDRAYAQGHPIPASYRTLLTERHFAEAALLREALAQERARRQASVLPAR